MNYALLVLGLLVGASAAWSDDFEPVDAERFGKIVPPDARLIKLGDEFKATEGPVWIGGDDGYLVFSDMNRSQLIKWQEGEGFSVYREKTSNTNGNALDPEGNIVSCEQAARRVTRIGPDGTVTVLADNYEGKRFNSPNDVVVRSDGTVWFTDPRYGDWFGEREIEGNYVYRIAPTGGEVTIATRDFTMPNGLCLSPDEQVLYIGQGVGGGLIRAYDIAGDGTLTNGREVCRPMHGGPDGLKCDERGNLYITSAAGVDIFSPDGEPLGTIRTQPRGANVAFGGEGRKTLFITAHHCLYSVKLNVPGTGGPKNLADGRHSEGQFLYIGADSQYVYKVAPGGTYEVYAEVDGATRGLAMDHDGTLWVATTTGDLFRVAPGPNGDPATLDNGAVTRFAGGIRSPLGMDIDPNGDFWIAEHYEGVVKIQRATGKREYINVEGGAYSVERGPNGHMYVSRQNRNTVYEFLPDGTPVRGTVADPEPLIAGYGDGHRSIAFSPKGDILLIRKEGISRFSPVGEYLGLYFDWEKGTGFGRDQFIKHGMKHPMDLAVDARGVVYGSDRVHSRDGTLIVGGTVFRYRDDGTRELVLEMKRGVNWMAFWPSDIAGDSKKGEDSH